MVNNQRDMGWNGARRKLSKIWVNLQHKSSESQKKQNDLEPMTLFKLPNTHAERVMSFEDRAHAKRLRIFHR